ncbi:MAG: AAA family ATPase, partial [Firmicutes bacterium]|nr:AAA family ATPase [Bacillota bacterium]
MSLNIAFFNQKGGVGKTTSCVNFSAYLAKMNKKVLIIDIDPQGNATSGLGIKKSGIKKSTYNVLMGEDLDADDVINKTDVPGLYIIPSSINLAGAEVELVNMMSRESKLKEALQDLSDTFDFITIDCPPSLGLLTINALAFANQVIIPIQSEFYALEGLSQLMNTIKLVKRSINPDLEVCGVLLTMFDPRSLISNQIATEIKRYFGDKVFKDCIPRNIRLSEAP